MPMLILTVDQLMDREKRDMYFAVFTGFDLTVAMDAARKQHFDWFEANDLVTEIVAPRGWSGGDAGLYAVFFTDKNDPRIAAYTALFETPDGKSLQPDIYQMNLLEYQSWLDHDGPQRLIEDLAPDE